MDEPVRLVEEPLDGPGGAALLPHFYAEVAADYPGWGPDVPPTLEPEDVRPPQGRWLVAYRGEEPVGCAGFKRLDEETVEIKRLFVAEAARGAGISRALLQRLEQRASEAGYRTARLDTGARQQASVALFTSSGYWQIEDYNGNPYAGYWFEKDLTGAH